MDKVSVVIPAYNEAAYITRCIEALQNQTVVPDEIIVVDNNSIDDTAQLAKSLGARVVFEKTPGITPARNAGFNAAKFPIIARCDADTQPHNNWIERIKDDLTAEHVIGVTGTNEFYDAPKQMKKTLEDLFTKTYFTGSKKLVGHEVFYGSNMAFKAWVWEKIKDEVCLDDTLVHEDIDLSIHMGTHGEIIFDPKLLVSNSARAFRVRPSVMIERLAKWPRTKLVHTRLKPYVKPGKKPSSSAQNVPKPKK